MPTLCACSKHDVGGEAPLGREAAQRLGADAAAGGEPDDRLQHHEGAAGREQREEPVLDLLAAPLLAELGLEDDGRGAGEHLHEGLVALGQVGLSVVRPAAQNVP